MLVICSQEVRSYMLFVLAVVCLLLLHWIVAVEGNHSRGFVLTYGLSAAILFYVHYLAIFVLFVLFGLFVHWAISSRLVRSRMWRLCTVGVMTAMLVSSGLALMRHRYQLKVELDHRLKVSRTNPTALSYGAGEPESSSVRVWP